MTDLCRYLAGRISAEVALARLLLAGASPDAIAAYPQCRHTPRGRALLDTLAAHRETLPRLRAVAAEVDHAWRASTPDDAVARIREAFDRALAVSPEASVAAYSLGDRAVLAAATDELVAWLDAARLIGPATDVLDLGCGIGRVAAALAPRVRSVFGLDVSPAMIGEARRRCTAANASFAVTSGADLAPLGGKTFDLVLAVDCFPYLVQAGAALAERHVADVARILRDGGAFAILNLSYRSEPAMDIADARRWSAAYGFVATALGDAPFALWDGRAFVLRRP